MKHKENNEIRILLENLRNIIKENDDQHDELKGNKDDYDAVPYTSQDELFTTLTDTAKKQFGADFSKVKNPMLYYPEDGDVVMSGIIPSLSDASFEFKLKGEGAGCKIWTNELELDNNVLNTLKVVNGTYSNWKDELTKNAGDIKPMGYKEEGSKEGDDEDIEEERGGMIRGDDF